MGLVMSDTDDAPHIRYFHMGQWPCYVGFTTEPEAFDAEIKRLKVDNPPEFVANEHSHACTHFLTNRDMLTVIVTIRRQRRRMKEQIAALIAHEAVHVMQEMENQFFRGGRFDYESQAYIVQYLTQQFLIEYNNPGKNMTRAIEP